MDLNAMLPYIIAGLSAWFGYNQHTKNKLTDYKIEELKYKDTVRRKKNRNRIARTYGLLWKLLDVSHASRIVVAQVHPLNERNPTFFTAAYEVTAPSIAEVVIPDQNTKLSQIAPLVEVLVNNDYKIYNNITEVEDKSFKKVCYAQGIGSMVVAKLVDVDGDWIGSVFIEYLNPNSVPDNIIEKIHPILDMVQNIIPDYE